VSAAGTYAELTGRPGVALCTRGPGVAAAVNGIAQAHLDRQPVVIVPDGAGFAHPHQRIDHAALVAPVAKGTVTDPAAAVALALEPPWGPVLIDAGAPERLAPPAGAPRAAPPARRHRGARAGALDPGGAAAGAPAGDGRRRGRAWRRAGPAAPRAGHRHPGADDLQGEGRDPRVVAERGRPPDRRHHGGAAAARVRPDRRCRARSGGADPAALGLRGAARVAAAVGG